MRASVYRIIAGAAFALTVVAFAAPVMAQSLVNLNLATQQVNSQSASVAAGGTLPGFGLSTARSWASGNANASTYPDPFGGGLIANANTSGLGGGVSRDGGFTNYTGVGVASAGMSNLHLDAFSLGSLGLGGLGSN